MAGSNRVVAAEQEYLASRRINVLEVLGKAIVGGMEKHVGNLIGNLPAEEFAVTVVCPFESAYTRALRQKGCQVYIAPLRDDPPWRSIEMIAGLVKSCHIDLIHAHLMNAHTVAALAGMLTGTPTVATLHGVSLQAQEISIARLTGTSMILVCREAWSQAMAVGLPAENLTLIPNGVDLERYHGGCAPRSRFRQVISVSESDFLVGFVGRLAWEKGPDKFIKAADHILRQLPDVHFALVGAGPMEKELTLAIDRAGISDNVRLAGLWDDVAEVYPALDLMLHVSRADAMPLAILEAMACGVPVIAVGVGGVPELVEAGETGILIGTNEWPGIVSEYPGDWEGVARAAIKLIGQPEKLKAMSEASVRRAAALYDIKDSAALTAQLFRKLSGRSGEARIRGLREKKLQTSAIMRHPSAS